MNDYIQLLLKLLEWAQDLGWFGIKVVVGIVVVSSLALSIPITYICYLCRKPLSKYCWSKFCPQDMERLSVSKDNAENALNALIDAMLSLECLGDKKRSFIKPGPPSQVLKRALAKARDLFRCLIRMLELLKNEKLRDSLLICKKSEQCLQDAIETDDLQALNEIRMDLFDHLDPEWQGKKIEEFEQLKKLKSLLTEITNQETP